MTTDEIPRYQLGAMLVDIYAEAAAQHREKLETLPEGLEKERLRKLAHDDEELSKKLRPYYGPRSERTKDPIIRDVEEITGVPFDVEDEESS